MTTWVALAYFGLLPMAGRPPDHAPAPATRSHVGLVASIANASCGRWRGHAIRFDFVDARSAKGAAQARFRADGRAPLELSEGRYDVRLYVRYKGGYSYYGTETIDVVEGGWVVAFGCRRGSDKPALWFE